MLADLLATRRYQGTSVVYTARIGTELGKSMVTREIGSHFRHLTCGVMPRQMYCSLQEVQAHLPEAKELVQSSYGVDYHDLAPFAWLVSRSSLSDRIPEDSVSRMEAVRLLLSQYRAAVGDAHWVTSLCCPVLAATFFEDKLAPYFSGG